MNKRSLNIVVSLVFILLVLLCGVLEIYFVEKTSIIQAFQMTLLQLTNLLIVMAFGMVLVFVALFLSARYGKRKK